MVMGILVANGKVKEYAKPSKNMRLGLLLLFIVPVLFVKGVNAQELKRYEVGGHFVLTGRFNPLTGFEGSASDFSRYVNPGLGGRFTYNLTRNIALETAVNHLPETGLLAGNVTQWFYGLKVGVRRQRVGLFIKAQPGYAYFNDELCRGRDKRLCIGSYAVNPAFDLGGVVEIYTKRRLFFRVDVSDVMVHYGTVTKQEFDLPVSFTLLQGTTNSLQVTFGVGIRF